MAEDSCGMKTVAGMRKMPVRMCQFGRDRASCSFSLTLQTRLTQVRFHCGWVIRPALCGKFGCEGLHFFTLVVVFGFIGSPYTALVVQDGQD